MDGTVTSNHSDLTGAAVLAGLTPAQAGAASRDGVVLVPAGTGTGKTKTKTLTAAVAGLRHGFGILDADDSKRLVKRTMQALHISGDEAMGDVAAASLKAICRRTPRCRGSPRGRPCSMDSTKVQRHRPGRAAGRGTSSTPVSPRAMVPLHD